MSRRRRYARTAVVGLLAAVMILGPLAALDDARPTFFGWHMYSANRSSPQIQVTMENGAVEARDLLSLAARIRPEVDYGEAVASFLCSREPSIRIIRVDSEDPTFDGEYQCSAW